ncbi:MauE/DoxX family redox-associated membrane protein [Sphingobacterium yanglingense]|uniref:Methylamine utilisation protein MauE domain-containing protein n=1 Tax=Sphingobacterium yanglingense TaxID=1437280 RepID=A0A4R6WL67_9SPHI|nr:MauE/DoxX family redox-associated membrane protein [Sphingobacterium yanglingense]TDQ79462.1 hypothetical protein CLV99_0900 [Sphingobacterium yanglingense]
MKIRTYILGIIVVMLLALWSYTGVVKLCNMAYNMDTMHKQLFPGWIANILAYLVPFGALGTAGLLLYRVRWGLWASVVLLSSFSVYIVVYLTEVFTKKTCSCAGIFAGVDYQGHLLFNTIMLCITGIALYINYIISNGEAENRKESKQQTTYL